MTKFDAVTKAKVLKAVRIGATYQLACDYAGIRYESFRRWMQFGENGDHPDPETQVEYSKFYADIKECQGQMAFECLERIGNAAQEGEWTAAAWKLERVHAKYYSRDSATIDFNERLEKLEEKKEDQVNAKTISQNIAVEVGAERKTDS